MKGKYWDEVIEYADGIRTGKILANKYRIKAVERFFADLENPAYEMDPKAPDFCIGIIEGTICHQQGETIAGEPLRGKPF